MGKVFGGGRGRVEALRGVSFSARRGEVLGLLGANGAGKTTVLRILAGFLAPSSGVARVGGVDVAVDSLGVRALVGYLPEQVPLPRELRVVEYLRYRAELKGVPRRAVAGEVEAVLARARVEGEARRIIGQLSKGYRQRVGLADALIGDPQVLLLDEPTDGLDPHQRREALAEVAALAKERTVILSTHVLPEVESVCSRVVILARGLVQAEGTLPELRARLQERGRISLSCRLRESGTLPALSGSLSAVAGVAEATLMAAGPSSEDPQGLRIEGTITLVPEADLHAASERLTWAVLDLAELRELTPVRTDLDALFRTLTASAPSADKGPEEG